MNTEEIEKAVQDIIDGVNDTEDADTDYTPAQKKALQSASFLADVVTRFHSTCSASRMDDEMVEGLTFMFASRLIAAGGETIGTSGSVGEPY